MADEQTEKPKEKESKALSWAQLAASVGVLMLTIILAVVTSVTTSFGTVRTDIAAIRTDIANMRSEEATDKARITFLEKKDDFYDQVMQSRNKELGDMRSDVSTLKGEFETYIRRNDPK